MQHYIPPFLREPPRPARTRRLQTPQPVRIYTMGWATGYRDWAKGGVLNHTRSNTKNFFVAWIAQKLELSIAVACNAAGGKVAENCDKVSGKLVRQFTG